jgi:hypothetical protein
MDEKDAMEINKLRLSTFAKAYDDRLGDLAEKYGYAYSEMGVNRVKHHAKGYLEGLADARKEAEGLVDYVVHDSKCILSFWEAGEPTKNGGYRSRYKGKWYESKPKNKEPKCNCGLEEVLAKFKERK